MPTGALLIASAVLAHCLVRFHQTGAAAVAAACVCARLRWLTLGAGTYLMQACQASAAAAQSADGAAGEAARTAAEAAEWSSSGWKEMASGSNACDVKASGAVGDNSTDDTLAIQKAMDE